MVEQIDIMRSVDWRNPPGRLPTADDNPLRQRRSQFHESEVEDIRPPAIRQCHVRFDERVIRPCQ